MTITLDCPVCEQPVTVRVSHPSEPGEIEAGCGHGDLLEDLASFQDEINQAIEDRDAMLYDREMDRRIDERRGT